MYAYAFEYKSMFSKLFQQENFKDNIAVVSIGCGNMIDYWGLVEAFEKIGNDTCKIKYKGIDTIDWNYKVEKREEDIVRFIEGNAATVFSKVSSLTSDVYIFPKSISEFSNQEFQEICDGFSQKKILKDRVHVLISLRSDQASMKRDVERSRKIVSALEQNGFVTKDDAGVYWHYENEDRGINKMDQTFEYPNEAIDLLSSLSEACYTYVNEGENCTDDCQNLNRWPVLKARNIRYQILSFDRKDLS